MESKQVFEFTYAEYPRDQPILGLIMVLFSFIPQVLPIIVITRYTTLKCNHHLFFFLGLVLSHLLAKLLKSTIKQSRPHGAFLSSYGMPSDHSQFLFFATSYLTIVLFSRATIQKSSAILTSTCMTLITLSVCYSRLYLGVHTWQQVVVGGALGIVTGPIWYKFTTTYLLSRKSLVQPLDQLYLVVYNMFLGSIRKSRKY
jgi:dolichyldiphosphatase